MVIMYNKDGSGVICCNHCGDQLKDGATVYMHTNETTKDKTVFCHGVCAGAYLSGILKLKFIVPSMVTTGKYSRPKNTMLNYKFSAWVHPKNGGDDYVVEGTMSLPMETPSPDDVVKKEITRVLKNRRSAILDDFTFKRV
jgi:hypothetical protein